MSPADRDRDVLTSLPNARPTRRSAKRPPRASAETPEEPAKNAAAPRKAAPRKKPAAAKKPRVAAQPQAEAKPASPPPPPAGWATPGPRHTHDGSTGDLIGTAVQAVGELAQIGLTYGGQALKQALSRLPKP